MKAFLRQVAEHYYASGNLEKTCFIFPNRRAIAFFKKYLSEEVAKRGKPCIAPKMLPINDFFYRAAGKTVSDRVPLLLELYRCYKALNDKSEPLDDFIFWGDVILSDFNDVDKYLVDARRLFTNISEFKGSISPEEYMSEGQKDALRRFLSRFGENDGVYKERFRCLWDLLLPLYENFNAVLDEKELSYEGKVYRALASRLESEPAVDVFAASFHGTEKYVFVGLNALSECEKVVLRKLRDARLARFCWDYSSDMIRNAHNKSSFFLSSNVIAFPQDFELDPEGLPETEFHALSVPSSVGQAKQLPQILSRLAAEYGGTKTGGAEGERALDGDTETASGAAEAKVGPAGIGSETAVILPDEKLLIPVLNSIPEEIRDFNVTMGYPLSGSELWSLMNDIAALQMHLRLKDGEWMFYHRQVWSIFGNSLFKSVLDDSDRETVAKVKSDGRYYVRESELSNGNILSLIFRPVILDTAAVDAGQCRRLADYLKAVVAGIASRLKLEKADGMAVEKDFAMEYYQLVGKLDSYSLELKASTWLRLLSQLLSGVAVPFKGEPLRGLQIMGPLETRALDFKNLVILSFNEGIFPHRSVASSFIPAELRKGFELPTYEYQDAVWAYYFYRMIQRAENVWMVFDSRTEVSRSGEESRYLKQLELHFGVKVHRHVLSAPAAGRRDEDVILKTQEDIEVLKSKPLSASALQNYLSCPTKFYYHSVRGLKEKQEISESLDAGMVGNVFHETMQNLYTCPGGRVSRDYLTELRDSGERIKGLVEEKIKEQLRSFEVTGRNLLYEDLVCQHIRKVIARDLELLYRYGVSEFDILGLELRVKDSIGGYNFVGYIDRLDSFADDEVRIVDYKTGSVSDEDFLIDDDNAEKVVRNLFGTDNLKRPKIALQLYLYDTFVTHDSRIRPRIKGRRILNSIYQPNRLYVKEVENVELSDKFRSLMDSSLKDLLDEISDLDKPFCRTEDRGTCSYCEFKMICGR